jgi:hypothetical protein
MSLHAMEIPDEPAQLPAWLEGHLRGPYLAELVAELSAVHTADTRLRSTLQDVLGPRRQTVLTQGLTALPAEMLRQFLVQPRLLLDLQELVLSEGGNYWQQTGRTTDNELNERVDRGRQRFADFLAAQARPIRQPAAPLASSARAWYRQPWLLATLALAATVLWGAFLYWRFGLPSGPPEVATGWGWSKPGALPDQGPPAEYLNRLADAAGEWFQKRPEDRDGVAQRIKEFRDGCSVLIAAAHQPLAAADRQWLVERCRSWADTLDKDLEALRQGQDPLQIRGEADATVNKLMAALRDRAKGLAL